MNYWNLKTNKQTTNTPKQTNFFFKKKKQQKRNIHSGKKIHLYHLFFFALLLFSNICKLLLPKLTQNHRQILTARNPVGLWSNLLLQSNVSSEIRPGGSGLFPVMCSKSPWVETAQPLWANCCNAYPNGEKVFSNGEKVFPYAQLCGVWLEWSSFSL